MAKRANRPVPTYEEFVFWVPSPSTYYSFRLQYDRRESDPYAERQSVSFVAECIYPDRFKGRVAAAELFADRDLAAGGAGRDPEWSPRAVGSIRVTKATFEIGGFLPPDICWRLGEAMSAGTITSMLTNGQRPARGHVMLNSISFHGPEFDPVAYDGRG